MCDSKEQEKKWRMMLFRDLVLDALPFRSRRETLEDFCKESGIPYHEGMSELWDMTDGGPVTYGADAHFRRR